MVRSPSSDRSPSPLSQANRPSSRSKGPLWGSLAFGVILPLEGPGRSLTPPEDEVRDFPRRRLRAEVEHPVVPARASRRLGERIHELGPVPVDPASRQAPATIRALAGAPPPGAG